MKFMLFDKTGSVLAAKGDVCQSWSYCWFQEWTCSTLTFLSFWSSVFRTPQIHMSCACWGWDYVVRDPRSQFKILLLWRPSSGHTFR